MQYDVTSAFRVPEEEFEASLSDVLESAHVLEAALEYVTRAVHSAFGHHATVEERRDHPRAFGLQDAADIEVDLSLHRSVAIGRHTSDKLCVRRLREIMDKPWRGHHVFDLLHTVENGLDAYLGRAVRPFLEPIDPRKVESQDSRDLSVPSIDSRSSELTFSLDGGSTDTVGAFFALDADTETTSGCPICSPLAREMRPPRKAAEVCPISHACSLSYKVLLSTPWQPDSVVTVDIFLNVRGIQSSTAESGPVTWSRRAGVVAPSSSVRLTWPSIIEYELYPSEDENRNAKSCALVLFKAWKLDHLPAVPSSHVAWAVMDCTKIDGINFNDRKGSKRGKALNVLKAAVLALETQYLDTTGSQPPMFRRDIGNDSLMMALGYKLRAFRMSLGDVSTLLLQEK